MSNLNIGYLPAHTRPGWNLGRLDTSRRILKTGPVQAPGPWKLDTSREDFRYSFEQQKSYLYAVAANSTTTITLSRGGARFENLLILPNYWGLGK